MESITQLKKMQKEFRSKIKKDGKKLIHAAFKEFFKLCPQVEAIKWTQYTHHFNDGDACTFGRYDFSYKVKGLNTKQKIRKTKDESYERWVFYCDRAEGFVDFCELDRTGNKKDKPFQEAFDKATADLFEAAFGDHC